MVLQHLFCIGRKILFHIQPRRLDGARVAIRLIARAFVRRCGKLGLERIAVNPCAIRLDNFNGEAGVILMFVEGLKTPARLAPVARIMSAMVTRPCWRT